MAPFEDQLRSAAESAGRAGRLPSGDRTRHRGDRRRRRRTTSVAVAGFAAVTGLAIAGFQQIDQDKVTGPLAPSPTAHVSPLPSKPATPTAGTSASPPATSSTAAPSSAATTSTAPRSSSATSATASAGVPLTASPGPARQLGISTLVGGRTATLTVSQSGLIVTLGSATTERSRFTAVPLSPGGSTVELVTTRLRKGGEGWCLGAGGGGLQIQACDAGLSGQRFEFSPGAGTGTLRLHNSKGWLVAAANGSVTLSAGAGTDLRLVDYGPWNVRVGD
jgi:hypothetical protein